MLVSFAASFARACRGFSCCLNYKLCNCNANNGNSGGGKNNKDGKNNTQTEAQGGEALGYASIPVVPGDLRKRTQAVRENIIQRI